MDNCKIIPVVAGILCNASQEILISFRPLHAIQGGLWEFPGGKIEAHETPYQALIRELAEEIGITVTAAHAFAHVEHAYNERKIILDVWWVDSFEGIPHGKEGQPIRWAAPSELSDLPFPEGNKSVIEIIQKLF